MPSETLLQRGTKCCSVPSCAADFNCSSFPFSLPHPSAGGMCPFRHISGEKTVVCKHWLRGLCKKGDQCEFLHEYDMTKMPECYFYSKFGKGCCSSYLAFLPGVGVWWRGPWYIALICLQSVAVLLCPIILLNCTFSDPLSPSPYYLSKFVIYHRYLLSQELVPWGKRGEVQVFYWVLHLVLGMRWIGWAVDLCMTLIFGELMSSRGQGGAKLLCTCFPALEIWT